MATESTGPASNEGSAALGATRLRVHYLDAPAPALDSVSITVPRGSFYAVLGPNGSGKSTLLRALLGMVPHAAGQTHVSGRPVSDWDRRALAREAGVVTQSESLAFPITVRELVAMGALPLLGRPPIRNTHRQRGHIQGHADVRHREPGAAIPLHVIRW